MARIVGRPQTPSLRIDKFLGLNQAALPNQLKPGEASEMWNFDIDEKGSLRKRGGLSSVFLGVDGSVPGEPTISTWKRAWSGAHVGVPHFTATERTDGAIELTYASRVVRYTGGGTGTKNCWFGSGADTATGNLDSYFAVFTPSNRGQIIRWDDEGGASGEVWPYFPVIATATPPTGGGTTLEPMNLLTNGFRQRFSGNGTAKAFKCRLARPTTGYVVEVWVDGVARLSTDATYPWNMPAGSDTLTFTGAAAPANLVNNVEIGVFSGAGDGVNYWCETNTPIHRCTGNLLWGGAADIRRWAWGDPQFPHRLYYTGIDEMGTPSSFYWPALNYVDLPEPITDCVRLYDRMIIFSAGRAWYARHELVTMPDGSLIPDYPILPLSDSVGQQATGQTIVCNSQAITLGPGGIYRWISTAVRDERNAVLISDKVAPILAETDGEVMLFSIAPGVDISSITCLEWQEKNQAWFVLDRRVLVWDYRRDIWWLYKFNYAVTYCALVFGVPTLCIGNKAYQLDLGVTDDAACDLSGVYSEIHCYWDSGDLDFKQPSLLKFLDRFWLDATVTDGSCLVTFDGGNVAVGYTGEMDGRARINIVSERFQRAGIRIANTSEDSTVVIRGIEIAVHTGGEA